MRRIAVFAALLLAACASAPPGAVRNMNPEVDTGAYASYSWGQPGITFDFYELSTLECLARAAMLQTQINSADVTPEIVGAQSAANSSVVAVPNGIDIYRIVTDAERMRSAQAREDRRQRQAVIDSCLEELGYVRFGLTAEQIARLEALPQGTPERKQYLYSLGSDPAVVNAQRL